MLQMRRGTLIIHFLNSNLIEALRLHGSEFALNLMAIVDLLQKSIFAPPAPQFWGENTFSRPPELGSQWRVRRGLPK
jgi:hypothetical protein